VDGHQPGDRLGVSARLVSEKVVVRVKKCHVIRTVCGPSPDMQVKLPQRFTPIVRVFPILTSHSGGE
jgi:hypothetical protein